VREGAEPFLEGEDQLAAPRVKRRALPQRSRSATAAATVEGWWISNGGSIAVAPEQGGEVDRELVEHVLGPPLDHSLAEGGARGERPRRAKASQRSARLRSLRESMTSRSAKRRQVSTRHGRKAEAPQHAVKRCGG